MSPGHPGVPSRANFLTFGLWLSVFSFAFELFSWQLVFQHVLGLSSYGRIFGAFGPRSSSNRR